MRILIKIILTMILVPLASEVRKSSGILFGLLMVGIVGIWNYSPKKNDETNLDKTT